MIDGIPNRPLYFYQDDIISYPKIFQHRLMVLWSLTFDIIYPVALGSMCNVCDVVEKISTLDLQEGILNITQLPMPKPAVCKVCWQAHDLTIQSVVEAEVCASQVLVDIDGADMVQLLPKYV